MNQLEGHATNYGVATGTVYMTVVLENHSTPCVASGYPEVALLDEAHHPVPTAESPGTPFGSSTPPPAVPVVLAGSQVASFAMEWTDNPDSSSAGPHTDCADAFYLSVRLVPGAPSLEVSVAHNDGPHASDVINPCRRGSLLVSRIGAGVL